MPSPTFTVVIPTRDRCDTLGSTLRSCVSQPNGNLSIVVSDNASTDGTREVVESFDDPRIRYVNTGRRVSMSSNWEFALHAVADTPENYVLYVGDDDALLPSMVGDVEAVIRATGTQAVAWRKAEYVWPSWAVEAQRNLAVVPLENRLTRYSANAALRDVKSLWIPYYRCPSLYNSFVSAAAVHRVRRRDGRFFHSSIPDAYSGFAVLAAIPWYLYSSRPFSVNGGSGHSTGASFGAGERNAGPRDRFFAEDDLPEHPMLRLIPGSIVLAAIEALYQANDHAFDGKLAIHRPYVIASFFREISGHPEELWADTVDSLEAFARDSGDAGFLAYVRTLRWVFEHRRRGRSAGGGSPKGRPTYGLDDGRQLHVDLARYGVVDVFGAANWIASLLGPYRAPRDTPDYRFADKLLARVGTWIGRRVPDWTL